MKKSVSLLILISLLLLSIPVLGHAAGQYYMIDNAGIFTPQQRDTLEGLANSVSSEYAIDAVILVVESLEGKSAQAYADDYYDDNNYYEDGLLFLLAIRDREMHISTSGSVIKYLDDGDIDWLCDTASAYFSAGDYFEGICVYLEMLPDCFEPTENISRGTSFGILFIRALPIGAVAALVVILIMRSTMNTKRKQNSAANYLKEGSFVLNVHQDIFLYSQVNKTPRQQSNPSSGSSVHKSSSGRSHGGGGRKF